MYYRRHQHYKQRKHSLQENSNWRRQSNTDGGSTGGARRISVQPEDATLEVSFWICDQWRLEPFLKTIIYRIEMIFNFQII